MDQQAQVRKRQEEKIDLQKIAKVCERLAGGGK
jgi:hypothetical protein